MSEYSVGLFLVPEVFLKELRTLEDNASNQPINTPLHQRCFTWNQLFIRAQQLATTSEIIEGPYNPLNDQRYSASYIRLVRWLQRSFLKKNPRHVLQPKQTEELARKLEKTSLATFLQWNEQSDLYGDAHRPLLTEIFEALERVLHARPSSPHGLVYANFLSEYRDPPPEPTEIHDRTSPEDGAARKWIVDNRVDEMISRERRPWWWHESPHRSRVLIGMVPPKQVDALDNEYRAAKAPFAETRILVGLAKMRELVSRVEETLIEPIIETMEGPVQVHAWLRLEIEWDRKERPRAICTPSQAVELERLLDQREEEELIEAVWKMEMHWTRPFVRDVYHRFRAALSRAIERGQGFAWLYDRREYVYLDKPDIEPSQ